MTKFYPYLLRILIVVCFTFALASMAQAQATRPWVSGVGDDANPCSRTAPCKTFAGAISKTAPGGVIDALDPGGFGAVTITKSIAIEGTGGLASILVSGTNALVIAAAAGDDVVLRDILFEGLGTGLNGIRFLSGRSLTMERCSVKSFTQAGIDFEPNSPAHLFVRDSSVINNGGAAILVKPQPGGSAKASVERTGMLHSQAGLRAEDNSIVSVVDAVASNNVNNGFL